MLSNTLNDKLDENSTLKREADLLANTLNDKLGENSTLNREASLFAHTLNEKLSENSRLNREADMLASTLNDKLGENATLDREANYLANTLNNKLNEVKEATEIAHPVEGDNREFAGRKFKLTMTLKGSDYNKCHVVNECYTCDGPEKTLAVTLVNDNEHFLNPCGLKLDLALPTSENEANQQFTFGVDDWNTVIDSAKRQGMVWDVADQYNLNPPEMTPFYLFPFHGRHNQHFVYQNNMIFAQQNGWVVTYVMMFHS